MLRDRKTLSATCSALPIAFNATLCGAIASATISEGTLAYATLPISLDSKTSSFGSAMLAGTGTGTGAAAVAIAKADAAAIAILLMMMMGFG